MGDWRLCLLSPWGGRVHAPWALALEARLRGGRASRWRRSGATTASWCACPTASAPPDAAALLPGARRDRGPRGARAGRHRALRRALPRGGGPRAAPAPAAARPALAALDAAQARRRPARGGRRATARSRSSSRPTASACRTCSTCPRFVELARRVRRREVRLVTVDTEAPSPFAASLLFGYVANYLYDGDAPLAERRAQALSVDQAQLRELLGEAELRELLDPRALAELELALQALDEAAPRAERRPPARPAAAPRRPRARGDRGPRDRAAPRRGRVAREELARRLAGRARCAERRAFRGHRSAGEERFAAAEDAAACATRSGSQPPPGLPQALPGARSRRAARAGRPLRAHARALPAADVARRLGIGAAPGRRGARASWPRPGACWRASSGPGGTGREWCDAEVLAHPAPPLAGAAAQAGRARAIRRRSRACSSTGRAWSPARRRAARRARRAARRGRAAPGRGYPGQRPGARRAARAAARLPAAGPRPAVRGGRGGLGGRGARSASATAGSRSYLADDSAAPARAARGAAARATSTTPPRPPRPPRRQLLRRAAREAAGGLPQDGARRALGPRVGGRGHERHARRAARVPPPRHRRAQRRAAAALPLAPARARRARSGRWSLVARGRARRPDADRARSRRWPSSCSRATACSPARRCWPRACRRLRDALPGPEGARGPAASAAATSWPASGARSSPSPARSSACARCARPRPIRSTPTRRWPRSCSPPPIPRTPTAPRLPVAGGA